MIGSTAVAPHPTTTGMHARLEAGRTFLAGEEGSGVSAMTRLVRAHPYEGLSERAEADRRVGAGSGRPANSGSSCWVRPSTPCLVPGAPRSPAMRG